MNESKPAPEPTSTTRSPGSRRRSENGLPTPANDSTARSGRRVDDRVVVAEAGREWAAGVEVVGAVRVVGDVAVLVSHLCAKGVDIDE